MPGNALQKIDPNSPMETWFTKSHKAAIVLASLSAETAAAIVEDISDAQLKAFAKAFCELKSVPPQLLQAVAEEFLSEITKTDNDLAGGADEARRVLGLMTEEDRAERILIELNGGGDAGGNIWERVEKLDDEVLAEYVQKQRMPVGAAILAKLDYEKTASVLNAAEDGYAKQILIELARKKPPSPAAIEAIAQVLEEDLLKPAPGAAEEEEGDGEDGEEKKDTGAGAVVGEIVNNLPGAKRDAFIAHINETDPEVGAAVKKALLIFEDLHSRVPESGAPAVMRDIERETLLTAIKHGEKNAPETVAFLFGNISKRMVEQYKEELAEMDEPSETDGEAAQREITSAVRRLVREGEFKLNAIEEPEGEEKAA
ncbi:FliG C-terminal domain-containing protein [Hyphococcus flavus]|uniref:Flagellar motor switch protein FliG n=1 Tax=Hyphococcus flavus TaxID=1866326 RepID=A0AAE9ZC06_9PROT|nr:FliG C-terminal domain-containing protein [Hyphococcus flavus]WDI31531.1 FliG C-terminal domain-containing protein [Hyphococcus flavus]